MKLDPAKHHFTPSSSFLQASEQLCNPFKAMIFERATATEISLNVVQSKFDGVVHLPCALVVLDRASACSLVNGHFRKLKK